MTAVHPDLYQSIVATTDVYRPQEDSRLLIDTLERSTVVVGRRVTDLCTGSGIGAIAAAELGAETVTAWDVSELAVSCARRNAAAARVHVDVRLGSFDGALDDGPYDVVMANPPYVPTNSIAALDVPVGSDPAWSWDGGVDGRGIVDPLCALAPDLLASGGTMLLVQSEFTGIEQSLQTLRDGGLSAEVVAWQLIPFGPVLTTHAEWLEQTGRLARGWRMEELVVIRADKR